MFESLFELLHIFAIDYLPALPFQIINILTSIILSYVLLLLSFTLVNLGGTRKGKMILGLVIFMGFTYALVVLNMFTRYLSCGLAVSYICRQVGHWAKDCTNCDKSPKTDFYKYHKLGY